MSSDDLRQAYEDKQGPLPLVEDADTGARFLIYQTESGVSVELQLVEDTFWASQRQIAEAFGVTPQNITIHLGNIFREGELDEAAACKGSLHTGRDGKRYVTKLYDLNAMISVGYRVGGRLGTAFRLWSTDKLVQYVTRGFVVDRKRLKAGTEPDRIAELREIIRDIRPRKRTSTPNCGGSARFARITTARRRLPESSTRTCRPSSIGRRYPEPRPWFGWNERMPQRRTWGFTRPGDEVKKADTSTAKNFLATPELTELNRLTTILLDVFDDQLDIGRLTLMSEARALLGSRNNALMPAGSEPRWRPPLRSGTPKRSASGR